MTWEDKKIERNIKTITFNKNRVTFSSIPVGSVFSFGGLYYIKTELLKTKEQGIVNCVGLSTGYYYYLSNDQNIIPAKSISIEMP